LLLVIKAVLAVISWLLAQFLLPRLGVTKETAWVSLLAALLALVSVEVTDYIAAWQADPELTVTTTHPKSGEIHLKVLKKDRLVNRLDIMYQVLGRVKSVQDSMAKTSVTTVTKRVVGYQVATSVNQLRIAIDQISTQETNLSFIVFYEPSPLPISIADGDRFQYRYTWTHKGDTHEREVWRLVNSNQVTSRPTVETLGVLFFTWSEEGQLQQDMRTLYEKPVPIYQLP
jgi:hypothetical protein